MYLTDFLLGLRRRWYVALVGLVLTAGLATGAALLVPVTYTSTTSLLMLPPRSALAANDNPYLNLGGLTQALEVLATRINASPVTDELSNQHPDATFEVGEDLGTTGPILLISSTADSPAEATQVRDDLAKLAPQVLVDMQTELNVQERAQIPLSVLAQDREPKREIKSQLRAVIAVAALAGGATILGTGYLDYLLALRSGTTSRRRRSRRNSLQSSDWWDEPLGQGDYVAAVEEPSVGDQRALGTSVANDEHRDDQHGHAERLTSGGWVVHGAEAAAADAAENTPGEDQSFDFGETHALNGHTPDSVNGATRALGRRGH